MYGAIPQFLYMRELFKRDYASKYYSSLPFALSMNLIELPYLALVGSMCVWCFYWSVGLDTGSSYDGFYFWFVFILFVFFCHSTGVFIAYVFYFNIILCLFCTYWLLTGLCHLMLELQWFSCPLWWDSCFWWQVFSSLLATCPTFGTYVF